MRGVIVVRKVTRVLDLDKGPTDLLQMGDGWKRSSQGIFHG